jgi:hypothetical protein
MFSYFFTERAAENIARWIEPPRVVLILRDPVERAYSAFWHMKKRVPRADEREFEQLINALDELSSEVVLLEAERDLVREAAEAGKLRDKFLTPDYLARHYEVDFTSNFPDVYSQFEYFRQSSYSRIVEQFEQVFGNRCLVVLFENLLSEPENVLERIEEFAGVDLVDGITELPVSNETRTPRNYIFRTVIELRRRFDLGESLAQWLERFGMRKWMAGKLIRRGKPELADQTFRCARELLGREYDYWKQRREETTRVWGRSLD